MANYSQRVASGDDVCHFWDEALKSWYAEPFPCLRNQNGRCVPDSNRCKQPRSLGKELPEELQVEPLVEFS